MSRSDRQNLRVGFVMAVVLLSTATSNAAPVHDAAQTGDLEQLQTMLTDDATLLNATGPMGTPLHYALFGQQLDVANYLLDSGADVNAAHQQTGFTPLHASVYAPDQTFAELLIKHGAEVNSRGVRGFAPLDLAILFGKNETAVVLITNGADVATLNSQGRLPLCQAAELGRTEVVAQLLAAGADIDARDEQETTPILAAVTQGRLAIVEQLLAHGARIDMTEQTSGRTPLQVACLAGHVEVVDRLLAAGARLENTDTAGKTALYYAARYGHRQVADRLVKHGARRAKGLTENYGHSPYLTKKSTQAQAVTWYLNHRGWAVKTRDHLLVFDAEEFGVSRPTEPSLANGFLTPEELAEQNLVGLFTCYHGDPGELAYVHTLADKVADASYVHLEADRFRDGERCVYLEPGQQHTVAGVTVRTIDAGTGNVTHAYLVEADDVTVFYLGFNVVDAPQFNNDIDTLAASVSGVDVVFLPIPNPDAADGVLAHVLDKLRPRAVCLLDPNRRQERFPVVARHLAASGYRGEVFCAEHPGDRFVYLGFEDD